MSRLHEMEIVSPIDAISGGVEVSVQDQTTRMIDLPFVQKKDITVLTTVAASVGDYTITVASLPAGIAAGDFLGIFYPANGWFDFAQVVSFSGGAPWTITMDRPVGLAYPIGSSVNISIGNLKVDGSSTPQVFQIGPLGGPVELDITRTIGFMVGDTTGYTWDDEHFGGYTALTRGLLLRKLRADSTYQNYHSLKTNGQIAAMCFDVTYVSSGNPSGKSSLRWRSTYGGQSKRGVVIRLGEDEALQIVVQDDLTTDATFIMNVIAEGHITSQ